MCYVRNDGTIVIEIKQLIFKRAGKPSESVTRKAFACFTLAY